jgi:hypothetical protein
VHRAHSESANVGNAAAGHPAFDPAIEVLHADAVVSVLADQLAVVEAGQRAIVVFDHFGAQTGRLSAKLIRLLQVLVPAEVQVRGQFLEIVEYLVELQRVEVGQL